MLHAQLKRPTKNSLDLGRMRRRRSLGDPHLRRHVFRGLLRGFHGHSSHSYIQGGCSSARKHIEHGWLCYFVMDYGYFDDGSSLIYLLKKATLISDVLPCFHDFYLGLLKYYRFYPTTGRLKSCRGVMSSVSFYLPIYHFDHIYES